MFSPMKTIFAPNFATSLAGLCVVNNVNKCVCQDSKETEISF